MQLNHQSRVHNLLKIGSIFLHFSAINGTVSILPRFPRALRGCFQIGTQQSIPGAPHAPGPSTAKSGGPRRGAILPPSLFLRQLMPATPPKRIFLIDAMGFVFRAFYAPMERLRSPGGLPTKVPYVFANMLRKLDKDWSPDYLAVVFDVAGPTFRDALYTEYKAQRPPMPEDLVVQLPMVRRVCEAMRLAVVERQGYEADDVIGTLSRQAGERGLDVLIVTADKDMLQLVRDALPGGGRIRALNPGKGDLLADEKKVEELMGVPPHRVTDGMALMGDSIDNIPGAKGIGEKGARELIQKYGSAEAALDHAAEVPGKRYRQALENSRDMVVLSKKLATIETHAPLELDLPSLAPQPPDTAALRALYSDFGFSSLLRELSPPPEPAAASAPAAQGLATPKALQEFLAPSSAAQDVAFWVESRAP